MRVLLYTSCTSISHITTTFASRCTPIKIRTKEAYQYRMHVAGISFAGLRAAMTYGRCAARLRLNCDQKQWQMPKTKWSNAPGIEPGDEGIWVTCDLHMEGLCTVETRDFFNEVCWSRRSVLRQTKALGIDESQCAKSFYGDDTSNGGDAVEEGRDQASGDIEAEIEKEVQGIQGSKKQALFVPVKLDIACGPWSAPFLSYVSLPLTFLSVLFFKTRKPVEPVSFVQRICEEAMNSTTPRRTKFVKRLTPMTRMGKVSEKSLDDTAKAVLAPVFHDEATPVHKVRFMRWP